jgi:hypothetical protein
MIFPGLDGQPSRSNMIRITNLIEEINNKGISDKQKERLKYAQRDLRFEAGWAPKPRHRRSPSTPTRSRKGALNMPIHDTRPKRKLRAEVRIDYPEYPTSGTFYLMLVRDGFVYFPGLYGQHSRRNMVRRTYMDQGWYWKAALGDSWDGPYDDETDTIRAFIRAGEM